MTHIGLSWPWTPQRVVAQENLAGLSLREWASIRNEIIDRHGRAWQGNAWRALGASLPWYRRLSAHTWGIAIDLHQGK